jgi:hypothetical protein
LGSTLGGHGRRRRRRNVTQTSNFVSSMRTLSQEELDLCYLTYLLQ